MVHKSFSITEGNFPLASFVIELMTPFYPLNLILEENLSFLNIIDYVCACFLVILLMFHCICGGPIDPHKLNTPQHTHSDLELNSTAF